MDDIRAELERANDMFREALPSWAKDGSAERPAGPPQLPLPLARRARPLSLDLSAAMVVGNEGGGGGNYQPAIVNSNGILRHAEVDMLLGDVVVPT